MLLIHPATTILPVQPATALEKPKQDDTAKIVKSSREFESLLLGNWLQQAEESFAKVPGIDDEEELDGLFVVIHFAIGRDFGIEKALLFERITDSNGSLLDFVEVRDGHGGDLRGA